MREPEIGGTQFQQIAASTQAGKWERWIGQAMYGFRFGQLVSDFPRSMCCTMLLAGMLSAESASFLVFVGDNSVPVGGNAYKMGLFRAHLFTEESRTEHLD